MERAQMGNPGFDDVATRLFGLLDTIAGLELALNVLVDHGVVFGESITGTAAAAQRLLEKVRAVGVDLEDVFGVLEEDGVATFAASRHQLLDAFPTSAGSAQSAQGSGEPDR
jgi:transaldolase